MKKFIIYGLYCPFTNELHYIGKSSRSMVRPLEHFTKSHSKKIEEWVQQLKFLNHQPIIKILEECEENELEDKERKWIQDSQKNGCYLLNVANNSTKEIISKNVYEINDNDILTIATIIRKTREEREYTQEEISKMAGISRKTYWEIENGNKRVVFNNLKTILNILGYKIKIEKNNE